MAKPLDLDEQEQLDQIKHFWAKYGNAISAVLIVVFGSIAAWNGWQYWQNKQGAEAAVLFDEFERAAKAGELERMQRALGDMQKQYGGTVLTAQAALFAAKTHVDREQTEPARAALAWVVESASDDALKAIARLRLSALDIQAQAWDAALAQLAAPVPVAFAGLVADRRGDGAAGDAEPLDEPAPDPSLGIVPAEHRHLEHVGGDIGHQRASDEGAYAGDAL